MFRRTLSLFAALIVALGAWLPPSGGLSLVCRASGHVTEVATAAVVSEDGCCERVKVNSADGAARVALIKAACCDLLLGSDRVQTARIVMYYRYLGTAPAMSAVCAALPQPNEEPAAATSLSTRPTSLRASPPLPPSIPRGPPLLS
jgi:hypothetical protein